MLQTEAKLSFWLRTGANIGQHGSHQCIAINNGFSSKGTTPQSLTDKTNEKLTGEP